MEKLACRLGDMARDNFKDTEFVLGELALPQLKRFFCKKKKSFKNFLGAMNFVMPNKYQGFSRSLEKVLKDEDRSGKKTKTSVYIKKLVDFTFFTFLLQGARGSAKDA